MLKDFLFQDDTFSASADLHKKCLQSNGGREAAATTWSPYSHNIYDIAVCATRLPPATLQVTTNILNQTSNQYNCVILNWEAFYLCGMTLIDNWTNICHVNRVDRYTFKLTLILKTLFFLIVTVLFFCYSEWQLSFLLTFFFLKSTLHFFSTLYLLLPQIF